MTIPTFDSAVDCTPWVIGGLWPTELSVPTPETRGLADYLRTDLQRITRRANDELTSIKRANLTGPTHRAHEARIIAEARAHAVRRIESTLRQQRVLETGRHRPRNGATLIDLDKTRVMPAITAVPPVHARPAEPVPERRSASTTDDHHTLTEPLVAGPPAASVVTDESRGGRHRAPEVDEPAENTSTGRDAPDPRDSASGQ